MSGALILRDYQREAIDDTRARWEAGAARVPVVLATGLGKSIIASTLADEWLSDNPGRRVLVIAHTVELIDQMVGHMRRACPGRSVGVVMGARNSPTAEIVVASRQTLASEKRREQLRRIGMIVIDECHFSVRANTYGKILEHFGAFDDEPRVQVVGFTATLVRGDKQKLSSIWEDCSFERNILFGIRNGYLLDIRGERIVVDGFDKGNIKVVGGDYSEASAAEELERTFAIDVIAKEYARLAHDRKGLAFWPLVATAEHASEVFNAHGIPSAPLSGQTPALERRRILDDLRSGQIQVVHNAMVLTTGFDEPSVEAILIARPMRSPSLYPQTVGRGLRKNPALPWDGQRPCLLLDAVGAGEENSLTPGVDLSPERRREIEDEYPDATLSEPEELYLEEIESELDEQRAGATYEFESDEYAGPVTTKAFDPLSRTKSWSRTADGTLFIKASIDSKADGFAFIVDSVNGAPGTFDVVICDNGDRGSITQQRGAAWGVSFDEALAIGEEEAGDAFNSRKASWRRATPSAALLSRARFLGVHVGDFANAGQISDEISIAMASRRIDPLVAAVQQRSAYAEILATTRSRVQ